MIRPVLAVIAGFAAWSVAWLIAGASRAKDPARSLLGAAPVPPELRGTGRVHVHALLSLPEAHLA